MWCRVGMRRTARGVSSLAFRTPSPRYCDLPSRRLRLEPLEQRTLLSVWYVDDDALPGGNGTLERPFNTIQQGIDAAVDGDTVHIAPGTYHERLTWDSKGIELLGAGADKTIIDAGSDEVVASAVTIRQVPDTGRLSGVTIAGGIAEAGGGLFVSHSDLTISNCVVRGNRSNSSGGGIYAEYGSPIIANTVIASNRAGADGGGICLVSSNASVYNSLVADNLAQGVGGGVYIAWSPDVRIANNVLRGNYSGGWGGAVAIIGSNATVVNNTMVANVGESGGGVGVLYGGGDYSRLINNVIAFNSSGIFCHAAAVVVQTNCFYGNVAYDSSFPVEGNLVADPRLEGLEYGRVHLVGDSPCIDVGDDGWVYGDWPDMDGQARIYGAHVDIGADEWDGTEWVVRPRVVRVSMAGDDSNDGSSWELAKRTIGGAVEALGAEGGEVWVAAGVYEERIELPRYVFLYGGFAGDEESREERDWRVNETVIDGGQGGRASAHSG